MLDIDFARLGIYNPEETFTCKIDVRSMFNVKCKYVKVRLRCPYRHDNAEEFRVYAIANRIDGADGSDQIVGKAENFELQRGRNQFIVTCKIPQVSDDAFKKYSNVIRCSFKVTVNPKWLPKRCCLDWFMLEPRNALEEVFDSIEDGGESIWKCISGKFGEFVG